MEASRRGFTPYHGEAPPVRAGRNGGQPEGNLRRPRPVRTRSNGTRPSAPLQHVGTGSGRGTGFTFVELLIAATMMSVLFVGLGAHLGGGVAVWRRTTQTMDALQRRRVALDRLEHDLANAIVYDGRDESYGMDVGKLPRPQFGDTTLAWFTVSPATEQQLPAIRFVTYRCEQVNDALGLWRTSQSVGEARSKRLPPSELVLPGCEELRVQYAGAPSTKSERIEWRAQWDDSEKELPRLLEVSIQLASGGRFTRMCAIPVGVLKSFGPPD